MDICGHLPADSLPMRHVPSSAPGGAGWADSSVTTASLLVILALLVCVLAWPGMEAAEFLDDIDQFNHVAKFQSWADAFRGDSFGLFRPFKTVVFYYFEQNGRPPLFIWHLLPLISYLLVIPCLFLFMRKILRDSRWALAVTSVWALSPTNASTAIWMSCYNISISLALACLALFFYEKWRENPRVSVLSFAGVLMLISQVAYETAVCIPLLCIALDLFRKRTIFTRVAVSGYLMLGLFTVGFLALRKVAGGIGSIGPANMGFDPAMPSWQLVVSAPWFLWRHFSMWFFPVGRIEFISTYVWGKSASTADLVAAWIFLLALVATWAAVLKRYPLPAFGLGWFLISSFPSSNLIPVWAGPVEDYYLVFPAVGLALCLVVITRSFSARFASLRREKQNCRGIVLISLILVILVASSRIAFIPYFHHQSVLWKNPLDLYLQGMSSRPCQFQNKTLAASELLKLGDATTARRFAEESIADAPWYTVGYALRGEIDFIGNNHKVAAMSFDHILSHTVPYSHYHNLALVRLGEINLREGKYQEARWMLLQILNQPGNKYHYPATRMLADIYRGQGNPAKARQTLEKSLGIHKDHQVELLAAIQALDSIPAPPPANPKSEVIR